MGGIATTPVINRPEVAIIGPNKIVERPVFEGDDIVRAKLMNLSISCDHRVVDGWDAASYVQAVKQAARDAGAAVRRLIIRHCERSEAIQRGVNRSGLRPFTRNDGVGYNPSP